MENLLIVVLGALLATVMGRMIIPKILIISFRKRLFDVPDSRKVHKRPIPRLGGIMFFPVILCCMCIMCLTRILAGTLPNEIFTVGVVKELLSLFAGVTMLYIIGVGDDLVGIRYYKKFMIQFLSAALFPLAGLYINNFYGLMGIYHISPYLGVPLTMVLVVFITNAINLIDGIDGLASSICIVALSMFGIFFGIEELWAFTLLAFICVGVLIPFFMYNVFGNADRGRKIFMGDTGSLTLGYILGFLVIKYSMYTGSETDPTDGAPIVIAFSILLVPCLDVIRVMLGRVRRGKSPFLPDKTHIHHKFLAMGFNTRNSLIIIQTISLIFIATTALLIHAKVNANIVFVLDVVVWTALNLWFSRVIRRKSSHTPL